MPSKKKPLTSEPDVLCSLVQMARILGISEATLYNLTKQGILKAPVDKKMNVAESVQSYLRYKKIGTTEENALARDEVKVKTEFEKFRLTKSQADLAERKVDVFASQYVARAEVETALAPIFSELQDELRAGFEREFPAWCVGKETPTIKAECQVRIDSAFLKVREGASDELTKLEAKAAGLIASEDATNKPDVLKPGRKRDPNSRRSERAKRHATEGRPAAGRKPKKKPE